MIGPRAIVLPGCQAAALFEITIIHMKIVLVNEATFFLWEGKYHCMADLVFDWFEWIQLLCYVIISIKRFTSLVESKR